MDLLDNRSWLTEVAGMLPADADVLIRLFRAKRLCLIRRHIGKFLTEKEFYEKGDIKNSQPYCDHLNKATGFVYEPEAYLIDMEPDFYALDYLNAWAAANVLRSFLEKNYGEIWFRKPEAGAFLKKIASIRPARFCRIRHHFVLREAPDFTRFFRGLIPALS